MGDAEMPEARDLHALFSSNTLNPSPSLLSCQVLCAFVMKMPKCISIRNLGCCALNLVAYLKLMVMVALNHASGSAQNVSTYTYGRTSILYQLCTFLCLIVCVHLYIYIYIVPVHFLNSNSIHASKKFSFQQWNLVKFLKDTKGMKMRVRL